MPLICSPGLRNRIATQARTAPLSSCFPNRPNTQWAYGEKLSTILSRGGCNNSTAMTSHTDGGYLTPSTRSPIFEAIPLGILIPNERIGLCQAKIRNFLPFYVFNTAERFFPINQSSACPFDSALSSLRPVGLPVCQTAKQERPWVFTGYSRTGEVIPVRHTRRCGNIIEPWQITFFVNYLRAPMVFHPPLRSSCRSPAQQRLPRQAPTSGSPWE